MCSTVALAASSSVILESSCGKSHCLELASWTSFSVIYSWFPVGVWIELIYGFVLAVGVVFMAGPSVCPL